ncbi:tRNA pseudouridine(38-40) synthase [Cetobacterium ceti]|uniref:tRNA pseudouridine(38-40) synthase n=1 Tax=Cetobacterium ceti TaxID=180163 RepID=A0A1T4NW59_9FUSO|nr:KH domain-containing protein [Cetobacterium ceti]SJZ83008.1 tRNA pseudouridine(38-40) synthase [Cetobacterium ceti]
MIDLRILEKSSKWGYMFYISYRGDKFQAFDEIGGKITVKGEFRRVMNSLGFTWAKGVQQGGRTDAKVNGEDNILYVSSNYNGDFKEFIDKFNEEMKGKIFIKKVLKTLPNLSFPEMISAREYVYAYKKKRITRSEEEIIKLTEELSGTYDVSRFTDKKGLELKEHIRTVKITYENGRLRFLGDSFMPKQVRITSAYILTDSYEPLPGKYLTLEKIYLKDELGENIIETVENIGEENVVKIEATRNKKMYIFYVKKEDKGTLIGKNGKNIKVLRKKYGNILIKEI